KTTLRSRHPSFAARHQDTEEAPSPCLPSRGGSPGGARIMLRLGLWRAAVGLLLAAAVTRADVAPVRDDFEKGEVGKAPAGWTLTTPGYRADVTRGDAREGHQCVRIRVQGDGPKDRVAILLRSVDAKPYRGRLIRMRGSVR